jgi:hypothetical protein
MAISGIVTIARLPIFAAVCVLMSLTLCCESSFPNPRPEVQAPRLARRRHGQRSRLFRAREPRAIPARLRAYRTLTTTLPFAWPASTYARASLVCSNGTTLSSTGRSTPASKRRVISRN